MRFLLTTRRTLAVFVMLGAIQPLWLVAQSGTSSALSGTLADQSGAAIVGAEVKAAEVNTGAVRAVKSNTEGRFLFSQVNPGTYRIEAHATGFGPGASQPTAVSVGQTATVNFTLTLAAT